MANINTKDSCKTCLFFIDGERMGICRRFPAPVNKSKTDWCGEYSISSPAFQALVESISEPAITVEFKKSRGRPKKS